MKPTTASSRPHPFSPDRHLQIAMGARRDPYQVKAKPKAPSVCRECGLVYHNGRWQKGPLEDGKAHRIVCPACRRTKDNVPAGILTLEGPFYAEHREEVLKTVRNAESRKRGRHPLQRIMRIDDDRGQTVVTTTDGRLTLEIVHSVAKAFGGEVDYQMQEGNFLMRARWYC